MLGLRVSNVRGEREWGEVGERVEIGVRGSITK